MTLTIRKLKDGNGVYLWQPSLTAGEPDKLLGYDLYTSAYVPTLAADAYTVAFGDFSYYWIADRQNRIIKRLVELYATNGQVGFVASQRVEARSSFLKASSSSSSTPDWEVQYEL